MAAEKEPPSRWKRLFSKKVAQDEEAGPDSQGKQRVPRWNMGMLNDLQTIEVPGSVLLLAKDHNEPLGLRNAPARTSHGSLPTGIARDLPVQPKEAEKKKTEDGKIILEPQPDDSHNDPLNWPAWRRDLALLSLGLYCCVGGGITPLIAAGFTNVAEDYHIPVSQVSLTTGLYMMGLAIGSVIFSPTAILYGKRPVYLFSVIIFILSSVWCALSPNFTSLILARIFQGVAVSPVECLPSATIAEIFFLHERAFRIGVYTLLLLGGKNLIPLVSAAIIQGLSWRWVFWIVAMVVAFCGVLLFFLVPETFWDRTPVPKSRNPSRRPSFFRRKSTAKSPNLLNPEFRFDKAATETESPHKKAAGISSDESTEPKSHKHNHAHVGFASDSESKDAPESQESVDTDAVGFPTRPKNESRRTTRDGSRVSVGSRSNALGALGDYFRQEEGQAQRNDTGIPEIESATPETNSEKLSFSNTISKSTGQVYTHQLRKAPPKSFAQQLKIYHGRLNKDKWWKAALRPLILFAYPAVLWSAAVYSCSIGWLIVISESVAIIFRDGTYKFGALSTGLIYLSPFIGGVLGTAVAGKVSDIIVKAMARRNGGLYEPEFRLVMAIPVAITTVIGLMGFGWSASVDDPWIVPTLFFGIVSFGCSLGSTTSITFCVDSYRQYAGEALVTLNFSKNIFHGLVFSLFVTSWLTSDGPKTVFVWIGVIQLIVLFFTIPMYIYGKRARMWSVRANLMEKF